MTPDHHDPDYIDSPAALIRAVPYFLGFQPTDSLVLVGIAGAWLRVTARVDLAEATTDTAAATLAATLGALRARGTDTFIPIVFAGTDQPSPSRDTALPFAEVIMAVRVVTDRLRLHLADALLVRGRRWWSYHCSDPACCPPAGRLLTNQPTAFEAQAVVEGMAPMSNRTAFAALLDPVADPVTAETLAAAEFVAESGRALSPAGAWQRGAIQSLTAAARRPAPQDLPASEVARYGVALRAPAVRDAIWLALEERPAIGGELWRTLATRLPAPYSAAPYFLYAWSRWRRGDGASAGIATERALAADPGYHAAELLLAALRYGLDPQGLPRLRAGHDLLPPQG